MTIQPAENLCRDVAGDDLAGHAVYVVDWAEISERFPEMHRAGALAWTSPYLDEALEPWLREQDRWQGPGFATIVYRASIETWRDTLGCVMHELAHWLTDERAVSPTPVPQEAICMALAAWCASEPVVAPPWAGHEAPFIRAAAHLAHRAGDQMESIRPSMLRFSLAYTGLTENTWMTALGSELGTSGSIRELLTTPAPAEFNDLWQACTEWWAA